MRSSHFQSDVILSGAKDLASDFAGSTPALMGNRHSFMRVKVLIANRERLNSGNKIFNRMIAYRLQDMSEKNSILVSCCCIAEPHRQLFLSTAAFPGLSDW